MTPAARTFECPHCAAGLTAHGSDSTVECPYCGSQVIVPLDVRAPLPPPPLTAPPAYYPPPTGGYPPPRTGAARRAMIFGITGLILSCLFFPVGLVFDLIALAFVASYQASRRANPQQPVDPVEAGQWRTAATAATIGLVLIGVLCVCALGIGIFAPGSGIETTPVAVP